jgi:phospholipid N-methyltransferase
MGYIRAFLRHPITTGSVKPSSRYLIKKMLAPIEFSSAKTIIELGPGNGCITKELLKKMHPESKLISIEINPKFAKQLEKINNPQLEILVADAASLPSLLAKRGLTPDYIVSGVPLGAMKKKDVLAIMSAIKESTTTGKFIQFQYTLRWHKVFNEYFDTSISYTPLNIPPAFVYTCSTSSPI